MLVCANQLSALKSKTLDYIKKLSDLGWNNSWQSKQAFINNLLIRHSIVVRTDADLKGRNSILVHTPDQYGNLVKVILIDKKFQESEHSKRYYKKYIVHEIGHLILDHEANRLNGWADRKIEDGLQETVEQKETIENEAEAMGCVILFWPEQRFVDLLTNNADLLNISTEFNAELDCCAKYILLRDLAPSCHYIKYNVASREFEDYYVPDEYDSTFYSLLSNVEYFVSENTALGQCVMKNALGIKSLQTEKESKITDCLTVSCKAFYRPKDRSPQIREDDKVICIGKKI